MNPVLLRRRRGFTLIELLVVIAIIATLMALLLPAIQKVREAANKMRCGSNIRQIVIAAHNYQNDNGHLPRSGVEPGQPGFGQTCCNQDRAGYSWLARLLPYIELGNLYTQGGMPTRPQRDTANPNGPTDNRFVFMNQPVKAFFCPTDNAGTLGTLTNRSNHSRVPIALTNYKGVAGANWQWGIWQCPGTGGKNRNGLDNGDGIFYRSDTKEKVRIEDIRDGTTNTFMVGEDISELCTHNGWADQNYATGTCCIPPNVSVTIMSPNTNPPAPFAVNNWQNNYSFRSRHTGGVQFGMADGSIRFVQNSINLVIYRGLATRAGNESVTLD